MLRYILTRIITMIPTLLIISALVFTIIELPPGDYFESYVAELRSMGETADLEEIEVLKERYGFDQPLYKRYFHWLGGLMVGDFGYSFEYRLPVNEVVGERLYLTILVSVVTIIFTWMVAFPIGIYSATHQYSWGDYGLSFLGMIGIAVPNFILALVMMYFANIWFGTSIGHLMDREYLNQPLSWDKFVSGMAPRKLLLKYPLRMALNFFVSDIGSILPAVISGAEVTAIVLSLETTGPMLIKALQSQDMYLAGSFLMFLAFLTVIGVLVSDIALALLDPRIRFGAGRGQ